MFSHKKAKQKLISLKLSAFLATEKQDVRYITGLELDGFWVLITHFGFVLFCPELLHGQLSGIFPGVRVVSGRSIFQLLEKFFKEQKVKSIGFSPKTEYYAAEKLKKMARTVPADFFEGFRSVKTSEEIGRIKKACRITVAVFRKIQKLTRPGVSEKEIAYKIEEYFAKNMAKPAFKPIVAFGRNSANPHHISSDRKARTDEVVLIDMGCEYNGYCSDLTRTFFLGKIPALVKNAYKVVQKAQKLGLLLAGKAKKASEIDNIARKAIVSAGFGENFIHSTGHGLGLDIHEYPRISGQSKDELKPGMVITIEPGVYFPGKFGIRIEDTVALTKHGCAILTK